MFKICFAILLLVVGATSTAKAQGVLLNGTIKAKSDGTPVEYATVTLKECELWAITDNNAHRALPRLRHVYHQGERKRRHAAYRH